MQRILTDSFFRNYYNHFNHLQPRKLNSYNESEAEARHSLGVIISRCSGNEFLLLPRKSSLSTLSTLMAACRDVL